MERVEAPAMHPDHNRIWELLPWYLNDSLTLAEHDDVRRHLGECLVCRRELTRLECLSVAVAAPTAEHASAQAFARLSQQIHATRPSWPQRLGAMLANVFEPVPLFAGAALLVVSSVLVGMIVLSGNSDVRYGEQPFQTLGNQVRAPSELSHPLLRVVLRDETGDSGLDAWLERHAAELVDGPSEIGVLTVRVAMGSRTFGTVIDAIRADQETLFIEPVKLIGTRPDRRR